MARDFMGVAREVEELVEEMVEMDRCREAAVEAMMELVRSRGAPASPVAAVEVAGPDTDRVELALVMPEGMRGRERLRMLLEFGMRREEAELATLIDEDDRASDARLVDDSTDERVEKLEARLSGRAASGSSLSSTSSFISLMAAEVRLSSCWTRLSAKTGRAASSTPSCLLRAS